MQDETARLVEIELERALSLVQHLAKRALAHRVTELAFVVCEATIGGKRFRNAEMHRVPDGRIVETQVFLSWNLPHPAAIG
jgi:hypothetical protein